MDDRILLILGRPFLYESQGKIEVGKKRIHLRIENKNMKFNFQQGVEHGCLIQEKEWPGEGHNNHHIFKLWITPILKKNTYGIMSLVIQ